MSDNEQSSQISKRRKMNFDNESASSQTKLFHLNADCLREIFSYLNTKDLANLKEANLNDCNETVNADCTVNNSPYETTIREKFWHFEGDYHLVTNDPTLSQFYTRVFRYFGSMISHVSLCYYSKYYRHNSLMERNILKYSTKFVTKMEFDNVDECAFDEIFQPFVNVKSISFEGGYLGKTLSDFNRWFPVLESLTLNETLFTDPSFIGVPFPNLKSLTLKNKHLCRCHTNNLDNLFNEIDVDVRVFANKNVHVLTNKNVEKFLELNPQLETLEIFNDNVKWNEAIIYQERINDYLIQINPEMLKFINKNVSRLRKLQLHLHASMQHVFWLYGDGEVNFKDLTSLSVEITDIDHLDKLRP